MGTLGLVLHVYGHCHSCHGTFMLTFEFHLRLNTCRSGCHTHLKVGSPCKSHHGLIINVLVVMHNWSLGKLQLQNFAYVNLKHKCSWHAT